MNIYIYISVFTNDYLISHLVWLKHLSWQNKCEQQVEPHRMDFFIFSPWLSLLTAIYIHLKVKISCLSPSDMQAALDLSLFANLSFNLTFLLQRIFTKDFPSFTKRNFTIQGLVLWDFDICWPSKRCQTMLWWDKAWFNSLVVKIKYLWEVTRPKENI